MKKYMMVIPVMIIVLLQACGDKSTSNDSQKLTGNINFLDQQGNASALQVEATVELYLINENRDQYYDPDYPFVGPAFDEDLNTDHRLLGEPAYSSQTSSAGDFEVDDIASGKYVCVYSAPGFGWHKKILQVSGDYTVTFNMRESMVNPVTVNQDETWGPDQHILLEFDMPIEAGCELTVKENTVIEIDGSSLIVLGNLVIEGNLNEPVLVTSSEEAPEKGDWNMIKKIGSGYIDISYAIIQWATIGLDVREFLNLVNSSVINISSYALSMEETVAGINDCLFYDTYRAVFQNWSSNINEESDFNNCMFLNNSDIGILIHESSPNIINCIFDSSEYLIYSKYNSYPQIEHCLFRNSGTNAIRSDKEYNYTGTLRIFKCNFIDDVVYENYFSRAAPILCEYNNFDQISNYALVLDYYYGGNEVDAPHNWWGTTSEPEIQDMIWDENDEPGGEDCGTVDYSPWLTEAVADTGPQ